MWRPASRSCSRTWSLMWRSGRLRGSWGSLGRCCSETPPLRLCKTPCKQGNKLRSLRHNCPLRSHSSMYTLLM